MCSVGRSVVLTDFDPPDRCQASGSNLLGGSAGGRDLAPEAVRPVRFAASLWCSPPVGLDRYLRGLSGSSPRSILIKICANKKIGESEG